MRFAILALALCLAAPSRGDVPDDLVPDNCSFDSGVLSCVYVGSFDITQTHTTYSGCNYGPDGVPGRLTMVWQDTIRVTETTTTLGHGLRGEVFDSSTVESRQIIGSEIISRDCEPL